MKNSTTREDIHYDILSLFGKDELEDIQNRLSKVTQLGFITINCKGEPITSFTGFCEFCQNFRNDKELYKNCEASDAISSVQSSIIKKPNIYKCPCGLMEIAIPIVIDDVYLGGFLCGQVKQLSLTVYKNNMAFDEKELYETIESDFSPQCLKLYPIRENIFQNYYLLESWFIQCYDYEYRQKVIHKYKILDVVFQYINQHIKDEISLSDIVDNCNISQGYLSKLFKKCFGITVMDYIHIRKIKLAKDMLNTTSMNIGAISYETGYNEPGYFSKVFKKYEGISAKEYQKKVHENYH